MSTLKVDGIRSNSASSDAITLANDGTCTANITNKPNRNLWINGAFLVNQRGSSSTGQGYQTVDRFGLYSAGQNESLTQAQVDVASGTTPYTLGLRKAWKITNGNQTSTDAADYAFMWYAFEAQDLVNSGWNYNSSSSYVTLSFWIKSSVAKSFKGYFITNDGSDYSYAFDTGSLSANTWTKVTKTIPGNSNITINNDNGIGLGFYIWPYIGTNYTDSSATEDAWVAHSGSARTKDDTSTWWTTNDATLEFTGFQLEVSDHATDFEHRSFAQELALCQRYYQTRFEYHHLNAQNGETDRWIPFSTAMRASPTITTSPTNSCSFGVHVSTSKGFSGDGSGNSHANFNLQWTASAEL